MNITDLILIGFIVGFLIWGILRGFVKIIGYFLALFLAVVLASHYYLFLSAQFARFISVNDHFVNILSFFILVGIFTKLLTLLINIIFKFISIVPLVDTANRVAGGILGFMFGILITGTFLYLAARYPLPYLDSQLKGSFVAPWILKVYFPITMLFPKILQQLKSLI